ncbi:hypothetical protein [Rhodovulum adriaticum]|uniref:Chemotaxis protein CheA n=1 Tax=Rhodovulum adriaticum TaxID=35804 RepID=A0A4R2NWH3_RHOAD|nr:hypothetical protein [Rhodovulum adriaticum]TCP26347.1 hypothetical protein EV656_102312 [Rhodovulum adriaticum]
MVGTSKILTVSYGTFSCTLEGFEDSFGTMKAIAEYFRDLAADDRYFGAEPPTPDAEMLQRIAEREIRKRVDAHVGAEGIVLRPAELDVPQDRPEPEQRQAEPARSNTAPAPRAESVAAKLARIRAVVETARDTAPAAWAPGAIGQTVQQSAAEPDDADIIDADSAEGPAQDDAAHSDDADAAPALDEAPAVSADEPMAEEVAPETADTPEVPVSETPDTPPAQADMPETAPETGEDAEIEEAAHPEDTAEDEPEAPQEETPTETAEAAQAEAEDTPEPVEEPEAPQQADQDTPTGQQEQDDRPNTEEAERGALILEEANETADAIRARVLRIKRDDLVQPDAAEAQPEALDAQPEAQEEQPETPDEQPEPQDAHPAPAATEEPAAEDEPAADSTLPEDEAARLPDDLEAELQAELAAATQEVPKRPTEAAHSTGAVRPPKTPEEREAQENVLRRLVDETNTKLEGPEQKRRLAAISHLKAAVAATVADRQIAPDSNDAGTEAERQTHPYREVLAKVVRGGASGARTPRPGKSDRLAPLMLVSEQRVDTPAHAPGDEPRAVRPRRVMRGDAERQDTGQRDEPAKADNNIFVESASADSFASFAEARGAYDADTVVAAACAYLTEVEDEGDFSRPQVMRLAMDHLGDAATREELLLSIGKMLRSGALQKIARGRFRLAEDGGDDSAERRQA